MTKTYLRISTSGRHLTVGYFQVQQRCWTWHDQEQNQLMARKGLKPQTTQLQLSHTRPLWFLYCWHSSRLIARAVPLADEGGGVLIMSDHGFCADIFLSFSWAFFFFSRILLHKSCKALVIVRPEIIPWQRNMWHLCLPVEGSLATKAKSLETKCDSKCVTKTPSRNAVPFLPIMSAVTADGKEQVRLINIKQSQCWIGKVSLF